MRMQKFTENDEERLVVEKLVNIIRKKQEKLDDLSDEYETDQENANPENVKLEVPAFTYQTPQRITPKDVPINEKPPFAVPPTDFRFYQNYFTQPEVTQKRDQQLLQNADDLSKIKILSSIGRADDFTKNGDAKKDVENSSTNEDDYSGIERAKMFSFFMLPPPENKVKHTKTNFLNSATILAMTYGVMCGLLVISIVAANFIYRNLRKKIKDAEEVDYPAYGVTGPNKDAVAPTGDRNLAHSAQMYHYQHQKQQIVAMEKNPTPSLGTRKGTDSGSEEDDLTVYECPGLAPVTGEMEVKNPMFQEEENVKSTNSSNEEKTKKTSPETKKTTKK